MDGTISSPTCETFQGSSNLTTGIAFSTGQTFKWQRTGTSLKMFINDSEKQEWTSVSATLRFTVSGFTINKADLSDITCIT